MSTTAQLSPPAADAMRASDADREKALGLLRDHWLAGRLSIDEYEERCDEAASGRFLDELRAALRELPYPLPEHAQLAAAPVPVPGPDLKERAFLAFWLGALSLAGAVVSMGLLFVFTLPVSTWAWSLGRRSRRGTQGPVRVLAGVAESLGILATAIACVALASCTVWAAT